MIAFFQSIGSVITSIFSFILNLIPRTVQALGLLTKGIAYIGSVVVMLPPIFTIFIAGLLAVCVVHIILEVV